MLPLIFDDKFAIQQNFSITRLWPPIGDELGAGPLNASKDNCTAGRPLVNLSLAINYHFSQLNPTGYHIFNAVAHTLVAMMLWATIRRVLRLPSFQGKFEHVAELLALAVALVWVVHPLLTECVQYITQRTEVMMSFFYLATMSASLRYFEATSPRGKTTWLVMASVACMLGMTCKEVMVSAPVAVLILDRTVVSGSFAKALRDSWRLYLGLAIGWLVLLALNFTGPRSGTAGFHHGLSAYVWWMTQAKLFWTYLGLAVWPWPQTIYMEVPYLESMREAWPYVLALGLLIVVSLVLFWRRAATGFLAACYFMLLSPTMAVPMLTEVGAERRMYLPLAVIATLLVLGIYELTQRLVGRHNAPARSATMDRRPLIITAASALVVVIVLGVATTRRATLYVDPIALWQDAEAIHAESLTIQNNLGVALAQAGRAPEAIEHFQKAAEIDPGFLDAHMNLGNALFSTGQAAAAIPHYENALRLSPDQEKAHEHLANALSTIGRPQDAIAHYEQALQLNPGSLVVQSNLAITLSQVGRNADAIALANKALQQAQSQGQTAAAQQFEGLLNYFRSQNPSNQTNPTRAK